MPTPAAHVAIVLALSLSFGPGSARAERMDRVVAVVGDRVVTHWDVQLELALEGHLPCPEPVLCDPGRPALDRVVDRALVRGLAADTATYRPTTEEVELRLADLRDSWAQPESYQRLLLALGLSEHDLSGLLFSRMVVERYVQRHVALPVYAAGGDEDAYRERWAAWIDEQRAQVRIRAVAPDDAGGGPESP